MFAHSQGLYPSGVITSTYMLGAAADEFWMQPGAALQSVGFANDDTFYKRFFDRWKIHPNYQQRYEYKNAANTYTEKDYTPAHREATTRVLSSLTSG